MVALVGACEPMESSGAPLQPVAVQPVAPTGPAPSPPAAPGAGPQGGFDFEADARTDEAGSGDVDPVALQAKLLGVPPDQIARLAPATPPAPAAAPAPVPAPAPVTGPPQLVWDPNQPLPDTSFGVRVLATLLDMQPPRAVLGLPDGSERVVQPGTFLEPERLVVLAVGRDAVQVAKVTPQGFYAKVETQTIRALYPNAAGATQP
jgi:hypothetical protein